MKRASAPTLDRAVPPPAERFRALITERLGLRFDDDKLSWLEGLLRQRQLAHGDTDAHRYLDALALEGHQGEWASLTPELTVGETYFFRHGEQMQALRTQLIPERLRHATGRPLRILSAGCSSGEEPYSIAMILADSPEAARQGARIDAVDINPQALAKARAGRYRSWSLRETPQEDCDRWFQKDGDFYLLDKQIRHAVHFSQRNLAEDEDPLFWLPESIDIVLCRNVLMYFDEPKVREILARFARALVPGGYLLLSHAETLRGLTNAFELCQGHGMFYHRRLPDGLQHEPASGQQAPRRGEVKREIAAAAPKAAMRKHPPAAATSPRSAHGAKPAPHARNTHAELLALFAQERYQDALRQLAEEAHESMPARMQALHALSWLNLGSTTEAERLCRQQLVVHPLDADVHHALAMCLAAIGDAAQARDHDQQAVDLDPAFAMPHLHLSLLWRQLGKAAASRQSASMALRLLAHEDAERIQLFGGGFGRAALIQMCRSTLNASGGTP